MAGRYPNPREGQDILFRSQPFDFRTRPERRWFESSDDSSEEIWALIDFFTEGQRSRDRLSEIHGWTREQVRRHHPELRSYLVQAREFYQAARRMSPASAPLVYYYSFLNLAKALLLAKRHEALPTVMQHGVSYRHEARRVRLRSDQVSVRSGVFRDWQIEVCGQSMPVYRPFKVADLLCLCPTLGTDVKDFLGRNPELVEVDPEFQWSLDKRLGWLRLFVPDAELVNAGTTSVAFQEIARSRGVAVEQVAVPEEEKYRMAGRLRLFQTNTVDTAYFNDSARQRLVDLGRSLRILPESPHSARYLLPLERRASIDPPGAIYGVMFYLGSLVRYQPKYVDRLSENRAYWLIEAFIRRAPPAFSAYVASELIGADVL